jgi:hypothetical protein
VAFIDKPPAGQSKRVHAPRQVLRPEAVTKPTIHLASDKGDAARFEVHNLPADLLARIAGDDAEQREKLLVVSVATAENQEATPMLGTHRVADGVLIFEPRYPLSPGVTYVAQLRPTESLPELKEPIIERFAIPKPEPAKRTAILNVFPTASELPENQLKFYIHFSGPMSRGQAYQHVRLLRENGSEVDAPFLEIGEELWDPTSSRFTLLCDPGRVKRGLKPREEAGPVLEEGQRYTLVVDAGWLDAAGFALKQAFRKDFAVLAPDDDPPDPANWKIAADQQTLTVLTPDPLDRGLMERVIWVETTSGQRLEGEIEIDRQETRWRFRPAHPWEQEDYFLAVERILEDRAGNRIGRKFEVDVFEQVDRQVVPEIVRIPFRVAQE